MPTLPSAILSAPAFQPFPAGRVSTSGETGPISVTPTVPPPEEPPKDPDKVTCSSDDCDKDKDKDKK